MALQLAENQSGSMTALAGAGVVLTAGVFRRGAMPSSLFERVAEVVDDVDLRRRLSLTGQRFVDGCGAERVVAAMRGAA